MNIISINDHKHTDSIDRLLADLDHVDGRADAIRDYVRALHAREQMRQVEFDCAEACKAARDERLAAIEAAFTRLFDLQFPTYRPLPWEVTTPTTGA